MPKGGGITKLSSADMKASRVRGESLSNFEQVSAKSEAELQRDIAADPDFSDMPTDWSSKADLVMPQAKRLLSLRLDADVLDWFREHGPGYQTRINAVLRSFVRQQQGKEKL